MASIAGGLRRLGKAARFSGGVGVRAGIFAANPLAGTALGVAEATARTGKFLTGSIRKAARGGASDDVVRNYMRSGTPVERARSFAYRHPAITAAGVGAMVGPGLYNGGPGSGSRVSRRNQNSYYVRRMRSGQSSGVAGLDPKSLGGFA